MTVLLFEGMKADLKIYSVDDAYNTVKVSISNRTINPIEITLTLPELTLIHEWIGDQISTIEKNAKK